MKSQVFVTILLLAGFIGFQSCSEKQPAPVKKNVQYVEGKDEVTYIKLGNEIADTVQAMLKTNLMKAMQEGGPVHAVGFCNTKAMELTDVYSLKYNTDVKRVSDRNRNPKNAADEKELEVLADFRQTLEAGQPLSPKIAIDAEGRKHYYAPIFTGGVCLTCHGDANNMRAELVSTIDSLYPNDKAKGYVVEELRGLWSIRFKNS